MGHQLAGRRRVIEVNIDTKTISHDADILKTPRTMVGSLPASTCIQNILHCGHDPFIAWAVCDPACFYMGRSFQIQTVPVNGYANPS
jgi:hypothetical protein